MALARAYNDYTKGKDMDGRTFVKVCKDCKLLDKNFNQTDCDLIFTKVKAKGSKRLTYDEFEKGIEEISIRKKLSKEDILQKMEENNGPVFSGTATDKVRFYDDKSTYTGVHSHGGPSTVDKPNTKFNSTFSNYEPSGGGGGGSAITLDQICDRSTPDIRGVNKNIIKH